MKYGGNNCFGFLIIEYNVGSYYLIYYVNYIFLFCRIFDEIYTNAPPILKDLSDSSVDIDYTKFIHDPIDFKTSI